MRWRERFTPIPMRRVALLAQTDAVRDLLVRVADSGAVELELMPSPDPVTGPATAAVRGLSRAPSTQRLCADPPDLAWCEQHDRADLIAGEAELEAALQSGVEHGSITGFVGWIRADRLRDLADRLAEIGGAVVELRRPPGRQPPTLLSPERSGHSFTPIVETYATPPYRDIDTTMVAGIAYVAMFGMMFADVGHGALLLVGALLVRFGHWRRLERLRGVWVPLAGAGLASMVFGSLYGEFFGPTHAFPVVWLNPLDEPVPLLVAAMAIGAGLLAAAYAIGTVNRFREGGLRKAVYASSGLAGAGLFIGIAILGAGLYWHVTPVTVAGIVVVTVFLAIAGIGFYAEAGDGVAGGAQAGVEVFDLVVRLGANVVSFARLAAFGLTHAALGSVVWQATTGLAKHGPAAIIGAIVVFAIGNTLTFSLEALIAAIQALRLEYYELFSRIFISEGEPFRPWHIPIERAESATSLRGKPCQVG